MKRLAQDLFWLDRLVVSNVWVFQPTPGRAFLIDTGHWSERLALWLELTRAGFGTRGSVGGILLTHRHSDHAGNAEWLRKKWSAPVAGHANDAPFLRGDLRPRRMAVGGAPWYDEILRALEDLHPARCRIEALYPALAADAELEVIPAFGHTEGSVMLYHAETRTLFSGDALMTCLPPWKNRPQWKLALPVYSQDPDRCHTQVLDFLRDGPEVRRLCPGHGIMMEGDIRRQVLDAFKSPAGKV